MTEEICSNFYKYNLGTNDSYHVCVSNRTTRSQDLMFLLIGVPIPLLSVIINACVLLAAGLQRKTLRRHNYVFSSVCSTLVSNMLYAVFSVWMAIANYLRFMEKGVRQEDAAGRESSEKWWIARNATLICLLLAMCGNIGSLVFVLMDSTYFVGRTVDAGNASESSQFVNKEGRSARCRFQLTKRQKAHLLIALSWAVPLLLVVLSSVTGWNCVKCCCAPGHYNGDSCAVEAGCSRFWAPVTHSFLGLFLAIWLVEIALMAWLLAYTSLKFRRVTADRGVTSTTSHDSEVVSSVKMDETTNEEVQKSTENKQTRRHSSTLPGCDPSVGENSPDVTFAATGLSHHQPSSASDTPIRDAPKKKTISLRFVKKFNSKMKSMMSLTTIFFVFTFPVVLGIMVDVSTGNPMPGMNAFIVISEISTSMYTLVCPIILLKFMPRLKLSVILCLYKCGKIFDK